MTDDQLYNEYRSGSQQAGDTLMLRYADVVTAYLEGFLHSAEDAEDLMLDCFTVLLVRKPAIREGHFRAYLFKMARNMANRLWKLRFRRQEFSLDEEAVLETLAAEGASPEDAVLDSERSAILQRCLNRITPQYREALWLYYYMDRSYAQIAEAIGGNVKKVEDLLRNGKKRLRQELEKEGITHADI